jgi:hypothetical protein
VVPDCGAVSAVWRDAILQIPSYLPLSCSQSMPRKAVASGTFGILQAIYLHCDGSLLTRSNLHPLFNTRQHDFRRRTTQAIYKHRANGASTTQRYLNSTPRAEREREQRLCQDALQNNPRQMRHLKRSFHAFAHPSKRPTVLQMLYLQINSKRATNAQMIPPIL